MGSVKDKESWNIKTLEPEEITKELLDIAEALNRYADSHGGKCVFICSICGFTGENFDAVDDRVFAYGPKEALRADLEELIKVVDGVEEDFIDW